MTTKAYNIGYALGSETARGVPVAHQGFQTPPASPYKSYKHFRAWYDGFVYGYRDVMAVRLNLMSYAEARANLPAECFVDA